MYTPPLSMWLFVGGVVDFGSPYFAAQNPLNQLEVATAVALNITFRSF